MLVTFIITVSHYYDIIISKFSLTEKVFFFFNQTSLYIYVVIVCKNVVPQAQAQALPTNGFWMCDLIVAQQNGKTFSIYNIYLLKVIKHNFGYFASLLYVKWQSWLWISFLTYLIFFVKWPAYCTQPYSTVRIKY